MATKKREIYARAAVQLRTHDRPRVAEEACPGAMGLYLFLLLQARGEQTAGEVKRSAALESWSAPKAYRAKQAAALIKAGLVEEIDGRLIVVRYLDHNDGPEEISKNKAASKKRYDEWYEREQLKQAADKRVGDALSAISISSSSGSSGSLDHRSEDPSSSPRADEEPDSRFMFAVGPGGLEAVARFEQAVAQATNAPCALGTAPWLQRDVCTAINTHGGKDLRSAASLLRWMQASVGVWVRSATPKKITPGAWLEWLNAKAVAPVSKGGGPRGDRQGLDGWKPKWAGTGTDGPADNGDANPFGDDS